MTAVLDTENRVSDRTASRREGVVGRWWFAGVGWFYVIVAVAGFVPQALGKLHRGDLPPVEVHVHGAIMGLFLFAFTAQATLAGRGDVALHRRLGWFATAIGVAAFLSMIMVLYFSMRREDPSRLPFLPQVWSLGVAQSSTFLVLFGAAVAMRRRPDWHRRLMAFAVLITLQGALDRMQWLPHAPFPSFWALGARLFPLAIPMVAFDVVTLRRVHPATLAGGGAIVLAYALLSGLWETDALRTAMLGLWRVVSGRGG